jgi:DNA-directed RNA polymerase subunit RPC12/RpoP
MYTYASNIYVCISCSSQFTLKTVSGVSKCLPNSVIDAQCMTYIFNGSNYECSQCQSTYEVKSVYTQSGTYKHCLLSTDSIRDCELYESITSGYQCRQCQNTANIARYSFILDSVSAFRCLDSQT